MPAVPCQRSEPRRQCLLLLQRRVYIHQCHLQDLPCWYIQAHNGRRRLYQLQIRNLFRYGGSYLIRQLRAMPCKLHVPGPKLQQAYVHVCRGLQGPGRRRVRGVCGGEVQGDEWERCVHGLRGRQAPAVCWLRHGRLRELQRPSLLLGQPQRVPAVPLQRGVGGGELSGGGLQM